MPKDAGTSASVTDGAVVAACTALRGRKLAADCVIPDYVESEHLRLMQRFRFLTSERAGRKMFYQVAEPHLESIMGCIESYFLPDTQVALYCPIHCYLARLRVSGMSELATVSVKRLAELDGQEAVDVIDVRTPAEFREVHAVIARNVPLDALDPDEVMKERNNLADAPLYVMCRSGMRSTKACEQFIAAGHTNVVNVEGGTSAWDAAGLPVVRGKKVISLERQVRIAAGFLVLLGAVPGFFVHAYFIGLSAFVGAGLVFAGITDTCGMAMVLAKMPWNQVKDQDEASCSR